MASFFHRKSSQPSQADNPYWVSFSDLMSGMLIIFILVCVALMLKLSQMAEEVNAHIDELRISSQARSEILKEIEHELQKHDIIVEISDNHTVLRIPDTTFHFATGRYDITDELRSTAKKIGLALMNAIKHDDRWKHLETVFVEGHSDSRPAPNFRMDNWELSALRAISLWQFWIDETAYGNELKNLTNKEKKHLFSVSGYAATRRVVKNESSDVDYQKNRRIDIRFTTRQPSIMELNEVIKPLRGE